MSTLAQIAASYGVEYTNLATLVGIDGVNPHAELNDNQTALIVDLIESSNAFSSGHSGRHRF